MFPAEEIPETLGTYRLVRRLPSAGAAEVYLARSVGPHGFQRECVLKLLPDSSEGDADFAEGLAREAAICAKMNHPAIVRVFDFFAHRGKLVLVLEHVEGTTLAELMQHAADARRKLGDAAIYHVGARLSGAIADAHAAKDEHGNPTPIIHRNLTPESVLVSVDGEVRLSGFGVGKILGRTPDTAVGRIKGTPGFMAPEQARGEPVTPKADVYGLGLLLWSLFAGRLPPTDGTWPRRITGLRRDLPKEVVAVVDAALDHFPGTRRISAHEMEQWLSKAAPAGRGKAELAERVAALRAVGTVKEADAPAPSRPAFPAAGNPFQGVRFGAPGAAPASRRPAVPKRAPRTPVEMEMEIETETEPPEPAPSAQSSALARGLRELPPPPPPAAPPIRFGAPPPLPAARPAKPAAPPIRFGTPPLAPPHAPAPSPEPPPVAHVRPPPLDALPRNLLAAALPPAELALPSAGPPVDAPPATPPRIPKPTLAPSAPTPLATAAGRLAALEPLPPSSTPTTTPTTRPPGARRPLTTIRVIAVSAATATMVLLLGLYVLHRERTAVDAPAPAAPASAATPAPSPAPAPSATPAPPPPVASAVATAAPAVPTASPADLPYGFGYLWVASPGGANVYLSGKIAGPTNEALKVRCGRWFARLAAPPESRYPEWVSPGATLVVACQQLTRVDIAGPTP